jgi:hypothetical protein
MRTACDIPIANRFKFANWQNLGPLPEGATQPRTHEFRQHKGTLKMEEIGQWASLTAITWTAERGAAEASPHTSPTKPPVRRSELTWSRRGGSKYKFVCTTHRDKTDELFDLLQLPRQDKEYWMARYERFAPDVFTKLPYSVICLPCELAEAEAEVRRNSRNTGADGKKEDFET